MVVTCVFKGELRDELLSYWHTLIKCPLYVTDKAEMEASNASRMQISENQRILSELDSASALHLTEKEIKKQVRQCMSYVIDSADHFVCSC